MPYRQTAERFDPIAPMDRNHNVSKTFEPTSVLRDLLDIPKAALWLGLAGLIPLLYAAVAGSLAPHAPLHDVSLQALLAYGAMILSFLGGIRWGLTMATADPTGMLGPLFASTVRALLGWLALLVPSSTGLVMLAPGFTATLIADLRLSIAPHWYRSLRLSLSVGAIISLLMGLLI